MYVCVCVCWGGGGGAGGGGEGLKLSNFDHAILHRGLIYTKLAGDLDLFSRSLGLDLSNFHHMIFLNEVGGFTPNLQAYIIRTKR